MLIEIQISPISFKEQAGGSTDGNLHQDISSNNIFVRRGIIIGVFFSDTKHLPIIGNSLDHELCFMSGSTQTTTITCDNMSPDLVIRGTAQIGELNKHHPKITKTSWIVHV